MTLSDAELLARHVAGDKDAFGQLFARHRDRLWAVALRTMGNAEDAADGLQDGVIAAFRRADSFRGDSAVTTWLHRIIVNACLDRIRASKSRATSPLPDGQEERPEPGRAAPIDPADAAVNADRRSAVLAALRTLPAEQRAALVLIDMEGYSVAEAAQILDCAEGTIKSRCARGRLRLAELLLAYKPSPHATPTGNQTEDSRVPPPAPERGPPPQ